VKHRKPIGCASMPETSKRFPLFYVVCDDGAVFFLSSALSGPDICEADKRDGG